MRFIAALTTACLALALSPPHSGAQTLTQEQALLKREIAHLDSKISAYALQNPVRTAAVVITFAGIFKSLDSYLTDQEAVTTATAVAYCITNFSDCAEAATYLAPLLRNRAEYQSRINQLASTVPATAPSRPAPLDWTPGTPHPVMANVVRGDRPGAWKPVAGYRWLRPDDPNDLAVIERRVTGVGVLWEINTQYGCPQVLQIFRDSPADRAGIPRGIIITKIDGIPTQGKARGLLIDLIRGREGSTVVLEYWSPVDKQAYTIRLVRRPYDT